MELSRLGRYELRKVLGKGAMGVVYEGFDTTLSRRVAVKTILKSVGLDPDTVRDYAERFAREAKAVARFNHPNIVQVYDFGEENDVAYLVMEFIEGRELRSFFVQGAAFDIRESVRIMGELLDALHFAHEAGVVHRDVKPANVMLDSQMRVKLADFGVARILESDQSQVGTMVGTPAFMSPEQISGGKIDRRTDVFSAGTILYQLLTGDQPFKGGGAWTVAKMIMEDDPPHPSSKVKSVSPVFDAIVNKALAKKSDERYASAKDFAQALRATLESVAPAAPAAPKAIEATASETEIEFWRSIQNTTDPDELEFYLTQFPKGAYAALARHKIAKLREPTEQRAQEEARRAAEEQARQEAEEKKRREAEAWARREAAEKAKREADEHARVDAEKQARQAAALAKMEAQAAGERHDPEATVALSRPAAPVARTPLPPPPPPAKKSLAVPAIIGAVVAIAGAAAFFMMGRTPAPVPVAEAPKAAIAPAPPPPAASPASAAPAVDEAKIRKEVEDRLRREYADKQATEQAGAKALAEKLAAEKAQADKVLAEKLAVAKTAGERAALEKAASDKAAADKVAAEKAAADKIAAEKAASEKAVADKIASEKAAAEKSAADKAAADKLVAEKAAAAKAAAKPGVPAVGDRWVYEARDVDHPDKRFTMTFEVKSVNGGSVTESAHVSQGVGGDRTHKTSPLLNNLAPGVAVFSPYLRAFNDLKDGTRWKEIPVENVFKCGIAQFTCEVTGRVTGRERVTVKAGSFDATKVVLDVVVRGTGISGTGSLGVELRYWYADAVNRYVKYDLRANGQNFSQPNTDMELVSYTPAGK